jgi:hypothetical protein
VVETLGKGGGHVVANVLRSRDYCINALRQQPLNLIAGTAAIENDQL